jgi:hypothetical protein
MNKRLSFAIASMLIFLSSCSDNVNNEAGYNRPVYYGPGIGLGTIIAVVVSWSRNKSILWAIVHGILGWLYVIYALLVKKKD